MPDGSYTEERRKREWSKYIALMDVQRKCLGDDRFGSLLLEAARRAPELRDIKDPAQLEKYLTESPDQIVAAIQSRLIDPKMREDIAAFAAGLFPFPDTGDDAVVEVTEQLIETGFASVPPLLSKTEMEELGTYLRSRPEFMRDGSLYKNSIEDLVSAPHAMKLATHPSILKVATEFLGCAPTINFIESIWTPAGPHVNFSQLVHRDKDDFRACKFFMYLTDVETIEDGAHVYARYSPSLDFVVELLKEKGLPPEMLNKAFAVQAGDLALAELHQNLFATHMHHVFGPAGTSFIENSNGLHYGIPPAKGVRGLFSVTYGLVGYPRNLQRFETVELKELPADCIDNELTRHAARLFLAA